MAAKNHTEQRQKLVDLMKAAGFDPHVNDDVEKVAGLILLSGHAVRSWLLPAHSECARTVTNSSLDHLKCKCRERIRRNKIEA